MTTAARNALSALIATVPAMAGRRVFWRTAPQSEPVPFVRLASISDIRGAAHNGADGLSEAIVQVDVFSDDPAEAESLRDAILTACHGYAGTVQTVRFASILHENSRDEDEPEGSFSASCDLRISYYLA